MKYRPMAIPLESTSEIVGIMRIKQFAPCSYQPSLDLESPCEDWLLSRPLWWINSHSSSGGVVILTKPSIGAHHSY